MPDTQQDKSEIPYYFCTYFDRNYLTRGLALYNSLRQHCRRPFVLWILCFDEETYAILGRLNLPGVRLITQQEFEAGDEALARAKADRGRVEYYWTCTPSLPLYVLQHHPEVELITYLDADLYFYGDPGPIYDELGEGSVLIVEHRYAPEYAYLAALSGIYNVGWMSFRRDERGLSCLHWWRERCLEWCYRRVEDGKFGDQKYLDDWPERFDRVVVLQHKGAGLAPWNYSRYTVGLERTSGLTVDGQPLIFYHFHGYKSVVAPLDYRYPMSPQQIGDLYLPYAFALRRAKHEIIRLRSGLNPYGSAKPGRLAQSVETDRVFWSSRWLAMVIWQLATWNRTSQARVDAGFAAYNAGDLSNARRNFLSAARYNPSLLCNRGVQSILLESIIGARCMNAYRRRKRDALPNPD